MLKILVILGSTREGRIGEKITHWLMDQLAEKYSELDFELIDLKELDLPIFNTASPKYKNKIYEDERTQTWSDKVDAADAFIVINPEYNHGYSAPLKNAFDALYPEWNNKPITFISYGGVSGGLRAVEQLRQVVVELQMVPIREAIHINWAWENLDEEYHLKDPRYAKEVTALVEQLQWWANVLKGARGKSN